MAIAGDAAATDPACVKSPLHGRMAMLIGEANAVSSPEAEDFRYRRIGRA
jgi:pyrroloquinoline quinone biosynthesis protein E